MNGCHVILVLKVERDKLVGVFDAVNEVTATLNHTLVNEFAERLRLAHITVIIEELVPETAVNQVTSGMLGTTHIEVHLTPILISLVRNKGLIVMRIHIAQVIGRRTCKARHGVQFQRITIGSYPVLGATQRRFASLGGQELVHLGQLQRQLAFIEGLRLIVLIIIDGERLTPIALTAEDGVAQTIVHLYMADASLLDILLGARNRLLDL